MLENNIAAIGSLDLQARVQSAYQPGQGDAAAVQAAREPALQNARREQPREAQSQAETKTPTLPVTNNSDVVLKFRVDEDSQAVTVYVVDRAADRVLRTIPADEIQKMSAGELVKMAA